MYDEQIQGQISESRTHSTCSCLKVKATHLNCTNIFRDHDIFFDSFLRKTEKIKASYTFSINRTCRDQIRKMP